MTTLHDTTSPETTLPDDDALSALFDFLYRAGDLKDTLRSGYTNGGRRESTAEHSWRLALMVVALEPYLEGYDMAELLKMAILHDLGEAVTGDVPAIHQSGDPAIRQADERAALASLTSPLPKPDGASIRALAEAYDAGVSPEAALMKGLDKLETIFQHATGRNAEPFDYAFNLTYGQPWTAKHPLLQRLRNHVDALTRARMESGAPSTGADEPTKSVRTDTGCAR